MLSHTPAYATVYPDISSLPPELLARIFRILRDVDASVPARNTILGWIYVTHVCRR
ncbi:hypothetical protein BV25DRAFT_166218 [Artomyces pyxidatus]|uniref:Uncharacterized protein n=1 Tax=Artomyces pyxidatus TaxID=48021 RepID=A0ACB8SIA1_9AGAM|nr:hypothetical protein BV25DRAFT_166218 [Artomyces pyxidatus]